ncbi:MAG: phosphoribosyltransferase [Bacteroidetes bacterium]|nr:phosphoribosyltransferase [Bacteroidota bacterium]MBS1943112.1 phosphoribosyltransferase [Bacteroidota bacterium]
MDGRTVVLEHERIQRKLDRMALQVLEQNPGEKHLLIVGVVPRGAVLAHRLKKLLDKMPGIVSEVLELSLPKEGPLDAPVKLKPEGRLLDGAAVVLVDDVLMSGRTLMHAAAHLVKHPLKRLTTLVLVDRMHRAFPIRADIVGLTLSTTMQEHISVEMGRKDTVYLS